MYMGLVVYGGVLGGQPAHMQSASLCSLGGDVQRGGKFSARWKGKGKEDSE
jgi:hypothetical protein